MTPSEETLRELATWWRGVAKDESEMGQRMATYSRGGARDNHVRAMVWSRCAQQLELVLAGQPFNPDL